MSYKVEYYTFAIMPDGSMGNIQQGAGHVFTDLKISEIPDALNQSLKEKSKIAIIKEIKDVGGKVL